MKYAVLLLALMFAGCGGGESSNDGRYEEWMDKQIEEVLKRKLLTNDGGYETFTIDGKTIQVAKEDFPNQMTWYYAMSACEKLGNGWRLPSIDELKGMHDQLHKRGKGNFRKDGLYWSSSEAMPSNAWYFYFEHGKASKYYGYYDDKRFMGQVRAVRALP